MNALYVAVSLSVILLFGIEFLINGQVLLNQDRENTLIWCTVNQEEQRKCESLSEVLKTSVLFNEYGQRADTFLLNCTKTYNKDDCMVLLDNNAADLTTLDPGEVFVGGRYHSLVPIVEERYSEGLYSVAVIRKTSSIQTLADVRGKRACFGGVGTLAGWVIPIDKLMKEGGMEIVDCNNHVKSALEYFGPSCAVNSLSDKYNPLGDNSHKMCEICGSDLPGVRCTSNDPYAEYEGSLQCVMDKGEIAFLKHSTIREYFNAFNYRPTSEVQENSSPRFNTFTTSTEFPFFFGNQRQTSTTTQRPPFGSPFDNNNQQGFSRDNSTFIGPRNEFGGTRSDFGGTRNEFGGTRNEFGGTRNEFGRTRNGFEEENPNTAAVIANRRPGPKSYNEFKEKFELLCGDGSRRDIDDWRNCNWGQLPAHAIVTSSAKPYRPIRKRYQEFIDNLFRQFGGVSATSQSYDNNFKLFESMPRFGIRSNLLFQDATIGLRAIHENDQTYTKYLGEHMQAILDIRSCPVRKMTLCITSDAEMAKCLKMREAMNAQLLKPDMACFKAHSHIHCMQSISSGNSDAAVFDAGDVYTAGYHYGLIPIMSEIYNTKNTKLELGEPEYYAVAVAYQGDADTELTYLKGKFSCHSGIGHGAGWIVPMAYLISSGRMRNYGCDSVTAASQYFTKSCVPGALSKEHTFGSQHNNLCDLCRGSSYSYCSRDASEDFYGYTGAFRCLVEGGGQVAFVKHTTASEVTDGKRRETWARNTLSGDYELLCRDGTRAPVTDYERCNLGKVKANAIVVRGGAEYDDRQTKAIINLFLYAQQFYGRKDEDDFSFGMFYSPPPYSDLIFQDAAQQLQVIPSDQRNYRDYLGKTFLKARALVDCRASVDAIHVNTSILVVALLFSLLTYSRLIS